MRPWLSGLRGLVLRDAAWFAARRLGPIGHPLGQALLTGLEARDRLAGRETDACIDGFPRSANTFAYYAFKEANPTLRLAHHMHTPIQVARAVDLGVPCAVLIRSPREAIASYLVFAKGTDDVGAAIRKYVSFHRHVVSLRNRIAICRFEEVVEDPGVVARRMNDVFGTAFSAVRLDDGDRSALEADLERERTLRGSDALTLPLPREERRQPKQEAGRAVASHPRFPRAQELYNRLTRDDPA